MDVLGVAAAIANVAAAGAVAIYTRKLFISTSDLSDAAKAQARAAEAATLVALEPIFRAQIERFLRDNRPNFDAVKKLLTEDASLGAAIVSARIGRTVKSEELEYCRVTSVDVQEIVPDWVDGSVIAKAFLIDVEAKPFDPRLQKAISLKDGYEDHTVKLPRWGTNGIFVIDEALTRAIYRTLDGAIDDSQSLRSLGWKYGAEDMLCSMLGDDWRASLTFSLAKTGYRTPTQHRQYKLEGNAIVVRKNGGDFEYHHVTDAYAIPQIQFRTHSPYM